MSRPPAAVQVDARELLYALGMLQRNVTSDMKRVHLAGAEIVAEAAREIVPRRSGALERSIRPAGQKNSALVRAGWRKEGAVYAGPIHFGWARRNIRPQPFLYEALDRRRWEVFEEYERQLADLIDEAGL